MVDEMIQTVRAALTPGADDATKQQAAAILRGLLGMLESGSAGPSPTPIAPIVTPEAIAPALPDFLTTLIERVRPFLPAEALAEMPRFRVPLIDFGVTAPKK